MRTAFTSLLLACTLFGGGPAAGADAPLPPAIRYVVPYAPGGPTDQIGRLVAGELARRLAMPVQVENRPGTNATLAAELVARAPADGSVLLQGTTSTHGSNPLLYRNLAYDPQRDFEPVVALVEGPAYVSVRPGAAYQSLRDLVAYARRHPGELRYGTSGPGSPQHLAGELLRLRTNTTLQAVHYRGAAPAIAALNRGEIDVYFGSMGPADEREGRVRVLAVASPERWPLTPDVPTTAEAGVPDLHVRGWFALFAPAGTPAAVVQRLNTEVNAVLAQPDVRARIEGLGFRVLGGAPADLRERVTREIGTWTGVVRAGTIRLD